MRRDGSPGGLTTAAILNRGVWKRRREIEAVTGLRAVYRGSWVRRPAFDCVVGWGLRPTSIKARAFAHAAGVPFLSIEDGFIRSVEPGQHARPLSLVVDRTGVHFDARAPSDLEAAIAASATDGSPARNERGAAVVATLRARQISKYNHAPSLTLEALGLEPRHGRPDILVVDQTFGDMSVVGGLAGEETFARMLEAALDENPKARIVVKTHPETASGTKRGYLTTAQGNRIVRIDRAVNPWSLIEAVEAIYTVSSQLGLEGLMAGKRVVCFGMPFYAGWGLTDDRLSLARRAARPSLEQLVAGIYLDYARYIDPATGAGRADFATVAEWLDRSRPRDAVS